ncbi:hypothetical protein SAMN04488082_12037 [Desulfomicrobium apsheronum]|jgi:hypothetical protein|uniref:DNA-binding protein n=1 Tax=Desulfomicrobium apsheronum TaxID=52560 RepID=A0A1I3YIK8_9BACT|nr:hypothetical protein [Desulfomicrobium apsheronum]SFK31665.1 hypothetical protein SAMN04488082_12037 [Desulfomicrobium apsheronum]
MSFSFHSKAESWVGELVLRSQIEEFSEGTFKPSSMRTLDSMGRGPAERIRVGGKIGYPKWPLAEWLDSKCRFEHRRSSAAQKDGAA